MFGLLRNCVLYHTTLTFNYINLRLADFDLNWLIKKASQYRIFSTKEFYHFWVVHVCKHEFSTLTKTKQTKFSSIFSMFSPGFPPEFDASLIFYIKKSARVHSEQQNLRRPNILISTLGCSELLIFSLVSCLNEVIFHMTKKPKSD